MMEFLPNSCSFLGQAELVNDLASWHPVFWPCIMLFVPLAKRWKGVLKERVVAIVEKSLGKGREMIVFTCNRYT